MFFSLFFFDGFLSRSFPVVFFFLFQQFFLFQCVVFITGGSLLSPMPGKILELLVEVGQEIEKDQPLVILEAMKMENELKAPSNGTISEIHVKTAQNVEKKQQILTILPRV